MFTAEELADHVAAYCSERISLKQFEDWFEANSAGAYDVPDLLEKCAAIDAAFSQYYFDHIGESALREELANAIRPFAEIVVTLSERARSLSLVPLPAQAVYRVYNDVGLPVNARIVLDTSMRVERIPPPGDVVRVPRNVPIIQLVSPVYAES
jgi:hypothetical protein